MKNQAPDELTILLLFILHWVEATGKNIHQTRPLRSGGPPTLIHSTKSRLHKTGPKDYPSGKKKAENLKFH